MKIRKILGELGEVLLILILVCQVATSANQRNASIVHNATGISSSAAIQTDSDPFIPISIDEAEEKEYTVHWVIFCCVNIRDHVLRKKVLLEEGDLFTRKKLEETISSLNRLKVIEPVKIEDVELHLRKKYDFVDITINVREKRRSR